MAPSKPTWSEAVREYLEHCEARGMSKHTMTTRASSFRRFQVVVGDVQVWGITPRQVDKVFANHNWTPGTRNQKLTHYKVFFGWCRARGYMHRDSNPLFGWKMETLATPERLRIPQSEWHLLFASCKDRTETMLIATGLYLFLRSNEKKALRLRDVHLDRGEIDVYRSKTKDYDVMPISAELDVILRDHLTWMATRGWTHPDHALILARTKPQYERTIHGHQLGTGDFDPTHSVVNQHVVVQAVLERAGYPTFQEGGHTLRRSGARAYFDQLVSDGYDGALRRVQSMLGHSHSVMTERYLGLNLDRRNRNIAIAGQPMFPPAQNANIVQLRREM